MSGFQIRCYRKKGFSLLKASLFLVLRLIRIVSKGSLGKEPFSLSIEKKSLLRAFSPTQTTMFFLTENHSPTITASRASLGEWPPYLRTRSFLVHSPSPSISSMHCGPRIKESMTVKSSHRRPDEKSTFSDLAWKETRQLWWENKNETWKDPEETTLSWEVGEDRATPEICLLLWKNTNLGREG